MDEPNEREPVEADPAGTAAEHQAWPAATFEPSSPMPLSMPPFANGPAEQASVGDGEEAVLEEVRADASAGTDPQVPGTALPGATGGAPPAGGQPPYSPPYGYSWSPGGLPAGHAAPALDHRRARLALALVGLLGAGLGAGLGISFAGTGASGPRASALAPPSQGSGGALSSTGDKPSVAAIAAALDPSVVDIRTSVVSPVGEPSAAAGTGMVITSSGEVLTNNHVIENAISIEVVVPGHGTHPAKVIGVNPTKDVALLQVEGVSGLPTVPFGDSSSVAVGDPVVAIGNALGMGGTPSVVTGEVSALGRTITASDPGLRSETLHGVIQTTAPIEPGDSGGPLVDAQGKVIGMDTAALSSDTGSSIGFAIPINEARTIVAQMQRHESTGGNILGTSPFLGVYESNAGTGIGSVTPFGGLPGFGGFGGFGTSGTSGTSGSSSVPGVTIAAIAGSSPAERAGLQGGDVITAIDGKPTPTWSALRAAVQARRPGDTITVTYVGLSGTSQTIRVRLAGLPQ
jgi:S1-C subfamily serine protease